MNQFYYSWRGLRKKIGIIFLIFIFYRYFKTATNLNMGEFPIELILKDKILMLSSFLVIIFTNAYPKNL